MQVAGMHITLGEAQFAGKGLEWKPLNCASLVLDDDERVRISLETFFADEGFRTQSASSGEEALEVLKAYAADVVIVDIRLPGMDGDRFMREAHRLYPELKFLVHTGSADYCLPQHMIEAGVVGDHVHAQTSNRHEHSHPRRYARGQGTENTIKCRLTLQDRPQDTITDNCPPAHRDFSNHLIEYSITPVQQQPSVGDPQ